ncbi:MAG: gliding motility lipoprotein GldH [Flavobacteriales bacterium]|nr:gliding motility lipoprotein GldH [Flavobacteriales bacterium]
MNTRGLAAGLLVLLLASCGDRILYQADVPIPGGAWHRDLKPEFAFEANDTIARHDLYIDVRHTGEYPFSSLFLFVDLDGPGDRHLRDTVECLLADHTGRWYGKGTGFVFADRYRAHVLYKLGNRFPAAGRYTIRLEQAMRTENLDGVLDVGITVERSRP